MKSFITRDHCILNGTPVIAGTRIPVERILFLFQQNYSIEEISLEYPQLSEKVIASVIEEIAENYGPKAT